MRLKPYASPLLTWTRLAAFKLVVSNVSSADILQNLVAFVNKGSTGLWGRLTERSTADEPAPFKDLLGTMWSSESGYPRISRQPAPPPVPGTLLVKTRYNCTLAAQVVVPPGAPPAQADVCCGNQSQVCSPADRCYISSERDFKCVTKRMPYAPSGLEGMPLDQSVKLTWKPPVDTGGLSVSHYIVSKVKFVVGEDVVFEPMPPTASNRTRIDISGLSNFVPYYFQVSAVSALGQGPASGRSSSLEPWIFPPGPPVNGRGFPGNKRVWLAWDPPRTDGGRAIEEYELWISNSTGLARTPPAWWRLFLAPIGNVTTNELPSFPYSVFESSRRRLSPLQRMDPSHPGAEADALPSAARDIRSPAAETYWLRNSHSAADPLGLAFLVAGSCQEVLVAGARPCGLRKTASRVFAMCKGQMERGPASASFWLPSLPRACASSS